MPSLDPVQRGAANLLRARILLMLSSGSVAAALISAMRPGMPGVLSRTHGNPYYTTKISDLNNLQYSRYMDATATHRLRGPEDVARYAAFISGVDLNCSSRAFTSAPAAISVVAIFVCPSSTA